MVKSHIKIHQIFPFSLYYLDQFDSYKKINSTSIIRVNFTFLNLLFFKYGFEFHENCDVLKYQKYFC